MTSSKQVNIRKNLRQSITNKLRADYGSGRFLGQVIRHDHVMLLQGVLIIVETPIYLNRFRSIIRIGSTLSHSRILKTCPGYSCSCPRRTPCNDYIIRYITTTRWHACSVLAPLRRCLADPQLWRFLVQAAQLHRPTSCLLAPRCRRLPSPVDGLIAMKHD